MKRRGRDAHGDDRDEDDDADGVNALTTKLTSVTVAENRWVRWFDIMLEIVEHRILHLSDRAARRDMLYLFRNAKRGNHMHGLGNNLVRTVVYIELFSVIDMNRAAFSSEPLSRRAPPAVPMQLDVMAQQFRGNLGLDPIVDARFRTQLHDAIEQGAQFNRIVDLIKKSGNIDQFDTRHNAMWYAIAHRPGLIETLLKNGASASVCDLDTMDTALHLVVVRRLRHTATVVQYAENVHAVNRDGRTALDLLMKYLGLPTEQFAAVEDEFMGAFIALIRGGVFYRPDNPSAVTDAIAAYTRKYAAFARVYKKAQDATQISIKPARPSDRRGAGAETSRKRAQTPYAPGGDEPPVKRSGDLIAFIDHVLAHI